jgi:methionyl-tRNA formyltransferase
MNIVFLGTDSFGIPALLRLVEYGHRIAGIVSTPPRPQGRGKRLADSPVAVFAREKELSPLFLPENLKDEEFIHSLSVCRADLFIVIAFRILPPEVFNIPKVGTINIHGSLLPRFRGPAPVQRAIEAGESETGITIFSIDQGVDTGKIILQKNLEIGPEETSVDLKARLSLLGAEALVEAIGMIESGTVRYTVQNEQLASRAPKLLKSEAHIDWSATNIQIFNRIRAFKPFPGTWTLINGRRLGIEWAKPVTASCAVFPGMVISVHPDGFDVGCGDGCLRVLEVKPEGKNTMSAVSFMNGTKVSAGTVLE